MILIDFGAIFSDFKAFKGPEELLQLRLQGLALLTSAKSDGQEAAREPRLMGMPWREDGSGSHPGIAIHAYSTRLIVITAASNRKRDI